MKKLLILAVIAGAFSLTSCKKDYTCSCTITGSSTPIDYKWTKITKKDAKAACDKLNQSGVNCSLK